MLTPDDPRLRLCVVTDDLRDGIEGLVTRMQAAERGGATMVLLRLKHADARTLVEAGRALVSALTIPVVIRDRLDVAMICGAAGVHLAADSMPVQAVRTQAPPGMLVAMSVSTADDLARVADADFVTVGPVFGRSAAGHEIEGFARLATAIMAPVMAVGGLAPERLAAVRDAGAAGVMLVQLPQSPSDIESYVRAYTARAVGSDGPLQT